AIGLWLLSGLISGDERVDPDTRPVLADQSFEPREKNELPRVRVRQIEAEPRTRNIVLRGRTSNKRTVVVKSEIIGVVTERAVERGQRVEENDLLCQLADNDRSAAVAEAEATLRRATLEYEGSRRLKEKGLQSDTAIAQAAASKAAAEASLMRARLNLERTAIRAPFAGVIEAIHANRGDYLAPGDECATLLDLDPMLLTARVTERDVDAIEEGDLVTARITTGDELTGTVSFVGRQSDDQTRTYGIEATVRNEDYSLRSGVTATLHIARDEVQAHRVSPALFALDDTGRIGVRILDDRDRVEFRYITILEDTPSGAWITGLPARTRLITVGQESVVAGQRVEPVFESGAITARATP
ncbi:MAG: efflux RND transporter periplasmic adaptor subunit, partial [Chromatocurvus sp.]